ncbi:glycoside hydrolase family 97 protein [Asticcacaulis machinosus]|uniref:Glycoside hydrolase family 97 catalytic domain-containing protein n=1 Tax=Asticcacaulis machinosus TaxID=2984211 RepID=A0ABT5HJ64_9CAUL|nr:glycoside hydrolase family 97 protein [Asticcacaulis machinosus]MDC7676281.1 glycoside hydrolase family 97 catalytic domain-containing protein [Asticcacaulis machinosus]
MTPNRRQIMSLTAAGVASLSTTAAKSQTYEQTIVESPDKRLQVVIDASGAVPNWSARFDGRDILLPSDLGLWLAEGRLLGEGAQFIGMTPKSHSGTWAPVFGQSSTYDTTSQEVTLELTDPKSSIRFNIIIRVFNGAAALRYQLVSLPKGKRLRLMGERTQFRFPDRARLYSSRDEGDIHVSTQSRLTPLEHPDLTISSDRGAYADLPLTVDVGNGAFAYVAESDRLHYPRCMVKPHDKGGLVTYLMRYPGRATGWGGEDETPEEAEFDIEVGQKTPWRVLLVSDSAKGLIEQHHIVPTLATPSQLKDVSWVRPGRAFRIMKPYSTEASLKAVDFADQHKIEYVLFDAHWYGDGTDASEPTYPIKALDLQRVIDYAKTKKIGVMLYIDRVAVTRALDAMCKLYRKWGVAGVKLGFMWEGRQSDVDFIHKVVKAFGEHRMVVNLHDNLRPAGLERTLPNYLTLEGVKGNEQFPAARHHVNLAYTRPIAGPIDYTICYAQERNQTTNAHQLALAVTCYSPLTLLYWYDKPEKYAAKSWPELKWFDDCPTTWDETRALAGEIGEYVVIARRKGEDWYLGVITNEMERRLELDLSFLGDGRWTATRYMDGALSRPAYKTAVKIETAEVEATTRLKLQLNAAGGQAIRFVRTGTGTI